MRTKKGQNDRTARGERIQISTSNAEALQIDPFDLLKKLMPASRRRQRSREQIPR
jgi:hypothetical protein